MARAIVGYLRVSTKGQRESGLGIEAQRAAIEAHARQSEARIVAFYTEVESGKLADRPELAMALAHAKRSKATLTVAKLDRLTRNVEFLARVLNAGTEFVACDNPAANRLTLHILAAVGEAEAKAISERTKAALAAYKARGGKLGAELPQCRNLTAEAVAKGRERSAEARAKAAVEAYSDLRPMMQLWRVAGLTLEAIAGRLNDDGHTTRRGKRPPREQPTVMTILNPSAAGIDVHSDLHMVCVPVQSVGSTAPTEPGGLPVHVRRFGANSCDLDDIADWLKECGVTTVAMESTGVYWHRRRITPDRSGHE